MGTRQKVRTLVREEFLEEAIVDLKLKGKQKSPGRQAFQAEGSDVQ